MSETKSALAGCAVGDAAPPPLTARTEAEIVADWSDDGHEHPRVSVLCATYQHAQWIHDAMQGFLGQRTNFPFEVLVRDDASTDGTAEIIREYANKYPRIVRVWCEPENTWPLKRAAFELQPFARGKLLAFCEGDDYWADDNILAAHVDAHEADSGVVISHIPAVSMRDGVVVQIADWKREWTRADALPHFPGIPLAAICARNVPVPVPAMQHRISSLDRFHLSFFAKQGRAVRVATAGPSVYRLHDGGSWSTLDPIESAARVAESYAWIARWWREHGDRELATQFELAAARRLGLVLPGVSVRARRRWPGEMRARAWAWRVLRRG